MAIINAVLGTAEQQTGETVSRRFAAKTGDLKLVVLGGVESAIGLVGGAGRRSDREPTKNCTIDVTSGHAFADEVTFLGSAIL